MDYKSALEFINSYTKSGAPIKSLDRIKGLMKKLGDPQSSLSFVHVAGTNGKGSVLEMISNALIDASLKVGQFTSPYIVTFEDRIRINGKNISKSAVAYYADVVKTAVENEKYSQFEIIFAIAMLYYLGEEVDVVCLEAGLGGLLDATNVIECPKAAVIASISLDHTDILGKTVEEIAYQKAGIIKSGGFAVVSSQNSENILNVFEKYSESVNASVVLPQKAQKLNGKCFLYKGVEYELSMEGEHQIFNATAAIEALEILSKEYPLSLENIKAGIKNAKVRARLEKLAFNPDIYFDGAHNPDAMEKLKAAISTFKSKKIGIVGMIRSKDIESAVSVIADSFDCVICVDEFYPMALDRHELAKIFQKNGTTAYTSKLCNALNNACFLCENDDCVIVFGSLYLYSHIFLEFND